MKKLFSLALVSLSAVTTLYAKDTTTDKSNECSRLHIQLGNASNFVCKLISHNIVHGKLNSSPPATIMAGYTERFDISQTLRGPEISIQYDCGGKQITFVSQQNYCFLKAGKVTGTVVSVTDHIQASYTSVNGSYYWSKPGLINWVINTN